MTKVPQFLILFILLLSVKWAGGQTNILKKLNFDEGEWKMFGILFENEQNTLQDSLGNFFTNDNEVFKSMQKTWKLKKHEGFYACGYHYKFLFIQNDTVEHTLMLNLNCREICGDIGCYEFPESMLRQFFPKLKQIPRTKYEVNNLQTARKLYKHLLSVDSVMIASENYQYWSKFAGVIEIEVIDSVVDDYVKIDKFVSTKIKADYPNEVFEIEKGSSTHPPKGADTYAYYVYCTQTMGSNFKTYKTINKWEAFDKLTIVVFGLTEEQIIEVIKTTE
jgi:hypothetical protein